LFKWIFQVSLSHRITSDVWKALTLALLNSLSPCRMSTTRCALGGMGGKVSDLLSEDVVDGGGRDRSSARGESGPSASASISPYRLPDDRQRRVDVPKKEDASGCRGLQGLGRLRRTFLVVAIRDREQAVPVVVVQHAADVRHANEYAVDMIKSAKIRASAGNNLRCVVLLPILQTATTNAALSVLPPCRGLLPHTLSSLQYAKSRITVN
jgi:hypothetical protein